MKPRIRSTCFAHTIHGAHNWTKGNLKLWCPGTDDSNPQIPDDLKKQLRRNQ